MILKCTNKKGEKGLKQMCVGINNILNSREDLSLTTNYDKFNKCIIVRGFDELSEQLKHDVLILMVNSINSAKYCDSTEMCTEHGLSLINMLHHYEGKIAVQKRAVA